MTLKLPELPYTNWFWEVREDSVASMAAKSPRLQVLVAREVTVVTRYRQRWINQQRDHTFTTRKVTPGWTGLEGTERVVRGSAVTSWDVFEETSWEMHVVEHVRAVVPEDSFIQLAATQILFKIEQNELLAKTADRDRQRAAQYVGVYR